MPQDEDQPDRGYASPPCLAHELDCAQQGELSARRQGREDDSVARWRKSERQRLIDIRLAVSVQERRRCADIVSKRLDQLLHAEVHRQPVWSFYWPFRGELNLRHWMQSLPERGVRVALPVAEALGQALTFREWIPNCRMESGVWNIPILAEGDILLPTTLIVPLVGYDGDRYRLGYGGGFFDRTLAQLQDRREVPRAIGVGHSAARIRTIYPRAHDIQMDMIITGTDQVFPR